MKPVFYTFADLEFNCKHPHLSKFGATAARKYFPNGYGVLVMTGPNYCSTNGTYGLNIYEQVNGEWVFPNRFTIEENSFLTKEEVTEKMVEIQKWNRPNMVKKSEENFEQVADVISEFIKRLMTK